MKKSEKGRKYGHKWLTVCISVAIIIMSGIGYPSNAQTIEENVKISGESKITPSDAVVEDVFFGQSAAVSGDTAVVGAPGGNDGGSYPGSAFVFTRSDQGWIQQAKLTASDAAARDRFGFSVAISGDTVVVGAHLDDSAGANSGSAYVFMRSDGVWTQQAKLTASDASAYHYFGRRVAISGVTVVVGATGGGNLGNKSGSAYVFTQSHGLWTQQTKLTASDASGGDGFGVSVAVSGDTAVVGSRADDDAGSGSGSAYVFTRSNGAWTQQAKLTALDAAARDLFGHSVAVSGNTAVVGSPEDDDAGSSSGSAYVFTRSDGVWTQQAKLIASDAAATDGFGHSVAISENTVVVGSPEDDDAGSSSGSAHIFTRSEDVWNQHVKMTASDAAVSDVFGSAVAISEKTAVVGAPKDDNSGSAYIYKIIADDNSLVSLAFDSPASSTSEETVSKHLVQVRLTIQGGVLNQAVSVDAIDNGRGTATPDADYVAFSPKTITFPLGSLDGDTQSFELNIFQDGIFEENETINLVLSDTTGHAIIGEQNTHRITIHEEEEESGPTTWHVNHAAVGANNGNSWTDAFTTLQNALASAKDGDQIWVATGTYTPDIGAGNTAGDRNATFRLKENVALYGGFSGDESEIDQRDWHIHVAILSGDLRANDEQGFVNHEENSYNVLDGTDAGSMGILDGFAIVGGNANGRMGGGGLFIGAQSDGSLSSLSISNCKFVDNITSKSGGGIAIDLAESIRISNCEFFYNHADVDGGGIHNLASSDFQITDSHFEGNETVRGTGGAIWNYSPFVVQSTLFVGNKSSRRWNDISSTQTVGQVINCKFFYGRSTVFQGVPTGSAIFGDDSKLTVVNSLFSGNSTSSGYQYGIKYDGFSATSIWNCTFANSGIRNADPQNGDAYSTKLQVHNSIFSGSSISRNSPETDGNTIQLTNCLLYDSGIDFAADVPSSKPIVVNSIFDQDPLFEDADGIDNIAGTEDDNLQLLLQSPAIDVGIANNFPKDSTDIDGDGDTNEPIPLDLNLNSRIANSGIDMGVYEKKVPAFIEFATSISTINETETTHQIQIRLKGLDNGLLSEKVSVEIADAGKGTASADEDYRFGSPTTLIFPAGSVNGDSQYLTLNIVNDRDVEGSETIELELKNIKGPAIFTVNKTHTTTIIDNEIQGKIYYSKFSEGTTSIHRANLDGSHQEFIADNVGSVHHLAVDGRGGKIYWSDSNLQRIMRANLDGSEIEEIVSNNIEPEVIALDPKRGHFYWIDVNDGFCSCLGTIQRANLDGSEIVTVVDNRVSDNHYILDLAINELTGEFIWLEEISLAGDTILEFHGAPEDEYLLLGEAVDTNGRKTYWRKYGNIRRSNLDGSDEEMIVDNNVRVSSIAIANIPFASVEFSSPNSTSEEGANVNLSIEVKLSLSERDRLGEEVVVTIMETNALTATSGLDYSFSSPVTITFPAGSVDGDTQSFELGIIQDAIIEGNELVELKLVNIQGFASFGDTLSHKVTISDGDQLATFAFSSPTSLTREEAVSNHVVPIQLTIQGGDVLKEAVSVEVLDSSTGTATADADYVAVASQTLTFPAGSASGTTQFFTIQPVQDEDIEGDETIKLMLSNSTGPAAIGENSTYVITISDDDDNDLMSYWNFADSDGCTINDILGEYYMTMKPGCPDDGPAMTTESASMNALLFDGQNDYMEVDGVSGPDFDADQSFTITVWARDDQPSGSNTWGPIIQKGDRELMWQNGKKGYGISRYGSAQNRFSFGISDGNSPRVVIVSPINLDGFHFLTLVVDRKSEPSQMRAYVDGKLVGSRNISHLGSLATDQPLRVGWNGFKFFKGAIGEVKIYDKALGVFAVDDSSAMTSEGNAVAIDVVANDTDEFNNLDQSSVAIVSMPENGTIDSIVDGVVTYSPNSGFTGTDRFTYSVADGAGLRSNFATVTVTVIPNNALLAHYSFETEVNGMTLEEVGLLDADNRDGALKGSPLATLDGVPDLQQAYEFDGVDDFIEVSRDANLDFGEQQSFSVTVWTRDDKPRGSNTWGPIVQKSDRELMWRNGRKGYGISRFSSRKNGFSFGISDGNNPRAVITSYVNSDGFHFLTLVVDRDSEPQEMRAYVDGKLIGKRDITSLGSLAVDNPLRMGWNEFRFYKGIIDDVKIYSRALTGAEIATEFSDTTTATAASMLKPMVKNSLSSREGIPLANGVTSQTLYEDAEDGTIDGWWSYGDGTLTNIEEATGNRTISTIGQIAGEPFRLGLADHRDWDNTKEFTASFTILMEEEAALYFRVDTTEGEKFLCYRLGAESMEVNDNVICIGLGIAPDGQWHTLLRDLKNDLTTALPSCRLLTVKDLYIYGSMKIDDVMLLDLGN